MHWQCNNFFALAAIDVCYICMIWISNLNSCYLAWSKHAIVKKKKLYTRTYSITTIGTTENPLRKKCPFCESYYGKENDINIMSFQILEIGRAHV